ncbi:MAG: hypothetical protein ACI33K_06735 [Clostridiaceae bacterium]
MRAKENQNKRVQEDNNTEKINKSSDKNSKIYSFLLISGIALFISILILAINKNTINLDFLQKNNEVLHSYIDDIHTLNNNLYSAVDKDTFNIEKALEIIPITVAGLHEIKEKLNSNTTRDAAKEEEINTYVQSLEAGIDNNIKFLNQLSLCFENPNAEDLSKSFTQLAEYKNAFVENYSKVIVKDKEGISLEKGEEFFSLSLSYLNEIIKLNRESNILVSQRNDFLLSIDSIVSDFKRLNVDYRESLLRVRRDGGSYEGIITGIDKDSEAFVELYHMLNNVTIPEDSMEVFEDLESCFYKYSSYIQSLRKAVYEESKRKGKYKDEDIQKLYESSQNNFNELQTSLNTFLLTYSAYKDQ